MDVRVRPPTPEELAFIRAAADGVVSNLGTDAPGAPSCAWAEGRLVPADASRLLCALNYEYYEWGCARASSIQLLAAACAASISSVLSLPIVVCESGTRLSYAVGGPYNHRPVPLLFEDYLSARISFFNAEGLLDDWMAEVLRRPRLEWEAEHHPCIPTRSPRHAYWGVQLPERIQRRLHDSTKGKDLEDPSWRLPDEALEVFHRVVGQDWEELGRVLAAANRTA